MMGLVLGGWFTVWLISSGITITEVTWGILIVIVGVIYLFLKFFKKWEQDGVFGLLTLVELVNFMLINGSITTFLFGGL